MFPQRKRLAGWNSSHSPASVIDASGCRKEALVNWQVAIEWPLEPTSHVRGASGGSARCCHYAQSCLSVSPARLGSARLELNWIEFNCIESHWEELNRIEWVLSAWRRTQNSFEQNQDISTQQHYYALNRHTHWANNLAISPSKNTPTSKKVNNNRDLPVYKLCGRLITILYRPLNCLNARRRRSQEVWRENESYGLTVAASTEILTFSFRCRNEQTCAN